jgi:hypothetical protein
MKMAKVALAAFLAFPAPLALSLPQDGGMEGEFLAWGAGARSSALGKAYVAVVDDATATYWNPAGLAWMSRMEVSALHAVLWEGLNYDYLSVAFPTVEMGSVGVFGTILTVGGGERRNHENDVVAGSFGMVKSGFGVSYAMELWTDFSWGVSLKHIGRSVDAQQSGFITTDVGFRWMPLPRLFVGGVFQHGVAIRYGDTEDGLPAKLRLGGAYEWAGVGTVGVDIEGNGRWHIGMESVPLGPLVGRAGADGFGTSGGLGIALEDWRVDYSAVLHAELGLSHWVSFSLEMGPSMPLQRRTSAWTAYREAIEAYTRGDAEAALRALEISLKFDPRNDTARRMMESIR